MGTINIQSTDLSHKAGLTYTGTSDKTIDVDSLVTKVSSTDNAIARYDGTDGAIQNSSVIIDDSGNVGIGTSSPSQKLDVSGNIISSQSVTIGTGGLYQAGSIYSDSNWGMLFRAKQASPASADFRWSNSADTERMCIDSSGNLLVGTTSAATVAYGNPRITVGTSARCVMTDSGVYEGQAGATVQQYVALWKNPNGTVGSISTNGSSTTYATSSDYRLKENIQPMQNALDTVAQLNPVTYTWKADGSDGQGFIAHELQAVVPDCVTGEKDAVDDKGNPIYQGIDTSFLVATLTKAIQELKAEVDDLKTQLEAK